MCSITHEKRSLFSLTSPNQGHCIISENSLTLLTWPPKTGPFIKLAIEWIWRTSHGEKTFTPEQIIFKLREVEVRVGQGETVAGVRRSIGVTEQTYSPADIAKSIEIFLRELQWFIKGKPFLGQQARAGLGKLLGIKSNEDIGEFEEIGYYVLVARKAKELEKTCDTIPYGGDAYLCEVIPW